MLVRDLVEYYCAHTRAKRLYALRSQVRPILRLIGDLDAEAVTGTDLANFRASRRSEGVSDSTVNRALQLLRAAYRMAVADEVLGRMPRFRLTREPPPRDRFASLDDLRRLLVELPHYLRDAVAWMFWSGWRKASVLGLDWSAVDLSRGVVRLDGARTKNGHPVVAPLGGPLGEIIARRILDRAPGSGLVFHRDGRGIGDFRKAWLTACRRAGIADLRPHDLRRSMARLHFEAGVRKEVTMALAGWRSESVYRGYLGLRDQDLHDAVRRAADHSSERRRGGS